MELYRNLAQYGLFALALFCLISGFYLILNNQGLPELTLLIVSIVFSGTLQIHFPGR